MGMDIAYAGHRFRAPAPKSKARGTYLRALRTAIESSEGDCLWRPDVNTVPRREEEETPPESEGLASLPL